MKVHPAPARPRFLFLQGPPGPFAYSLAEAMRKRGVSVHRINICAGDRIDWPEPAINYRGRFSDWTYFFDDCLRKHDISDILLFGDCRPYHVSAHRIATQRGIRIHVLEEGYLRPDWMTLELDGVNAHSRLLRDKNWFVEQAKALPEEAQLPPVTASFRRRVRDTTWHYTAVYLARLAYPHYRTHRPGSPVTASVAWILKYLLSRERERQAERTVHRINGKPFFLLPLQLSGDYQIRAHSPFPDMPGAAAYVLESFAANAPSNAHLLIKAHPLDCSLFAWSKFLRRRAAKLGIGDRVSFIDGGNLDDLVAHTVGMVCVNSTSATLALQNGTPVCALGEAIYKFSGMTFDGHVDQFWSNPMSPEPGLYEAFRRVLVDRCLVRGGIASESAVTTLVDNMADRLCDVDSAQSVESHLLTEAK